MEYLQKKPLVSKEQIAHRAERKRVDEHYAKGQKERAEGKAKAESKRPKAKVKSTTGWRGLIDSLSE